MSARILIVTSGPLSRNPRPLKEASTLGSAGYDVTVLTVRDQAAAEVYDRTLIAGAPFQREVVDMIPGFGTPSRIVFGRRLMLWTARRAANRGMRTIHVLGPIGPLLRNARRFPADLIIVHNEAPHWVGVQLMKQGRKVAADIEDWHSEDLLPEDRLSRPLSKIRAVEQALVNRAAYATTTSQALAGALQAKYGGRGLAVISNSFPLQPDPHRVPVGQPPSFFWFSQTLGPGRGLELFLSAWRQTRQPSRLALLGQPTAEFNRLLLTHLPADRHPLVDFLPPVSPAELPAIIARHDVGLALEQSSIVNRDLAVTNKLLQYLNAGLAIAASDTAGQREVLAQQPEAGLLLNLSDPADTANRLDHLLSDRPELSRRQQAARRLAEDVYCWEKEAPRLLSLVAEALQTRPAS